MRSCVSHVARGDPLLLYTFIISLSTAILYDAIKSILSFCVSPLIMPCTLRSFLGWITHSDTSISILRKCHACWTQSYDSTDDGSPSPYKMMYKVALVKPCDVEYDRTQQCDHGTSPPKRKSRRLDHALYPKYHMTFRHIHLTSYNMPLVDIV